MWSFNNYAVTLHSVPICCSIEDEIYDVKGSSINA